VCGGARRVNCWPSGSWTSERGESEGGDFPPQQRGMRSITCSNGIARSPSNPRTWQSVPSKRDTLAPREFDHPNRANTENPGEPKKMTCLHNNPCQPHWNLVERPEDYIWSSARFHLLEEPAIIPSGNANLLLA
jgi:hypothetical protein